MWVIVIIINFGVFNFFNVWDILILVLWVLDFLFYRDLYKLKYINLIIIEIKKNKNIKSINRGVIVGILLNKI